jgi:hypothetical protein
MKRQWTIKRQLKEIPDGQKRWNQAYQILLKAESPNEKEAVGTVPAIPQARENLDENSTLCSGFNPSASPGSNDRSTT